MTQQARAMMNGPALGMKVTAGIGAAYCLVMIVLNVLGIGVGATEGGEEGMASMMSGVVGIVFLVIGLGVAAFLWVVGGHMANLRNYNLCLIGAIVAMVPCISPCCILGLPIGIWAVVVMSKPEVKQAFATT